MTTAGEVNGRNGKWLMGRELFMLRMEHNARKTGHSVNRVKFGVPHSCGGTIITTMAGPEYRWRQLTPHQKAELLEWRKARGNPWHSPPHRPNFGHRRFHIAASSFNHQPHIGYNRNRLEDFTRNLLEVFSKHASQTHAWCVLPNHYHALVEAPSILGLLHQLGRLHGRTSHAWNGQDNARGRKVFFRAVERAMRSERHYWATLNYVHHNPVHHRYVERWTDWPWSSAAEYLAQTNPIEAKRIWREYPLDEYGKGWDDPEI